MAGLALLKAQRHTERWHKVLPPIPLEQLPIAFWHILGQFCHTSLSVFYSFPIKKRIFNLLPILLAFKGLFQVFETPALVMPRPRWLSQMLPGPALANPTAPNPCRSSPSAAPLHLPVLSPHLAQRSQNGREEKSLSSSQVEFLLSLGDVLHASAAPGEGWGINALPLSTGQR